MKNKIFLYSLTSLAVSASSLTFANVGQEVEVPALVGGVTASVGTFLVTPTSDFQNYNISQDSQLTTLNIDNVNPGYQLGIDASIGYIFEETANSVELFFRNVTTSDNSTSPFTDNPDVIINGDLGYELNAFDLMFNQFVNFGEVMQARFGGGLAYVELERNENITGTENNVSQVVATSNSTFSGFGPRVSMDTRYGFTDDIEGLGIVGGASLAYYLGDMDSKLSFNSSDFGSDTLQDDPGNHAVFNFRANLGLDYVYFFDNEESTLGLELGYLIDYYDDSAQYVNTIAVLQGHETSTQQSTVPVPGSYTSSISFAGPYLNLKGVF